jgi:hypothetical protein
MPGNIAIHSREVERVENCDPGSDLVERRRRTRLRLRWAVCFLREDGRDLSYATTVDISSDGFYCLSNVTLPPGQVLGCLLLLPTHDPEERERRIALECRVRVLRVNNREIDSMFGIACQIEDHHFSELDSRHEGAGTLVNGAARAAAST